MMPCGWSYSIGVPCIMPSTGGFVEWACVYGLSGRYSQISSEPVEWTATPRPMQYTARSMTGEDSAGEGGNAAIGTPRATIEWAAISCAALLRQFFGEEPCGSRIADHKIHEAEALIEGTRGGVVVLDLERQLAATLLSRPVLRRL